MEVLQSQINPASATFKSNMAHNLEQVRLLRERLQHVQEGGGARAVALHRQRGKLLARERIDTLLARFSDSDEDAGGKRHFLTTSRGDCRQSCRW